MGWCAVGSAEQNVSSMPREQRLRELDSAIKHLEKRTKEGREILLAEESELERLKEIRRDLDYGFPFPVLRSPHAY